MHDIKLKIFILNFQFGNYYFLLITKLKWILQKDLNECTPKMISIMTDGKPALFLSAYNHWLGTTCLIDLMPLLSTT